MLGELKSLVSESEQPLGYVATLISILGMATVVAYVLSVAGVGVNYALAFGILAAILALAVYYLFVALKTSSKLRKAAATTDSERIKQLESQRDYYAKMAEDGQHSVELAKIVPVMVPYLRSERHGSRPPRVFVGVTNKASGSAQNVTVRIRFRKDSEFWEESTSHQSMFLPAGEKLEYPISQEDVDRAPTDIMVAVSYYDMSDTLQRSYEQDFQLPRTGPVP